MISTFNKLLVWLVSCGAAIDTDQMMLLMMSQQNMYHGDNHQMGQMQSLMPLMLLSKSDSDENTDNTDMLMLMMLQNPSVGQNGNAMLPFLLMSQDDSTKTDKKALFLAMSMMNRGQSCTGGNMGHIGEEIMTHMLYENNAGKDDLVMTMLMMQAMSGQNSIFSANQLIPHMLVDKV